MVNEPSVFELLRFDCIFYARTPLVLQKSTPLSEVSLLSISFNIALFGRLMRVMVRKVGNAISFLSLRVLSQLTDSMG